MTKHSILPPSSAARRVACPGSRALEAAIPNEETEASREGEAAHWVAAQFLTNSLMAIGISTNHTAVNGVTVTPEMIEGAKQYAEYVNSKVGRVDLEEGFVEKRIDIPSIHSECWGTVDCFKYLGLLNSAGDPYWEVHIFDYKFGHKYVEVFENWQLIEYSAGILNYLGEQYISIPVKVYFHIVQPRCYGSPFARAWEIDSLDLEPYFQRLRAAEALSLTNNAPLIPGAECKYCRARGMCPALRNQSAQLAKTITESNTKQWIDEKELADEITTLRSAADILDARLNGISQEAISLLESGRRVPGYRLERTPGSLMWKKSVSEILALGETYGVDLKKPTDAITPTQAMKLKIDAEIIKQYSERKEGAAKLVEDKIARKIFGGKK